MISNILSKPGVAQISWLPSLRLSSHQPLHKPGDNASQNFLNTSQNSSIPLFLLYW